MEPLLSDPQAPAPRAGLRRENPGPVRQGHDDSATLVSEITADLDAEVAAWRARPLQPVWPIVHFDGIVAHVRGTNGRVSQHTIYVALGVNLEGHKELLGLWLGENEGAKFWLACLTDLRNRGLNDIFVACIDGLSGFPEAIRAAYPQASVQSVNSVIQCGIENVIIGRGARGRCTTASSAMKMAGARAYDICRLSSPPRRPHG